MFFSNSVKRPVSEPCFTGRVPSGKDFFSADKCFSREFVAVAVTKISRIATAKASVHRRIGSLSDFSDHAETRARRRLQEGRENIFGSRDAQTSIDIEQIALGMKKIFEAGQKIFQKSMNDGRHDNNPYHFGNEKNISSAMCLRTFVRRLKHGRLGQLGIIENTVYVQSDI